MVIGYIFIIFIVTKLYMCKLYSLHITCSIIIVIEFVYYTLSGLFAYV